MHSVGGDGTIFPIYSNYSVLWLLNPHSLTAGCYVTLERAMARKNKTTLWETTAVTKLKIESDNKNHSF